MKVLEISSVTGQVDPDLFKTLTILSDKAAAWFLAEREDFTPNWK